MLLTLSARTADYTSHAPRLRFLLYASVSLVRNTLKSSIGELGNQAHRRVAKAIQLYYRQKPRHRAIDVADNIFGVKIAIVPFSLAMNCFQSCCFSNRLNRMMPVLASSERDIHNTIIQMI